MKVRGRKSFFSFALVFALAFLPARGRAVNFDVSAGYSTMFTHAASKGLGSASYARLLGTSLKLGYWTPAGTFELESSFGFDTHTRLQDLSIWSLSFRRYLYRQENFGPEEFWRQSSMRTIEPYYGFGVSRVDQLSVFLSQNETLSESNVKAWGPHLFAGAEWDLKSNPFSGSSSPRAARQSSSAAQLPASAVQAGASDFSLFGEVRFSGSTLPVTVPAFVFYQVLLNVGLRARF
ncbi:MAG: hypothetical protein RIR26_2658 [Pseudomonadota bacterium]|jgi:hypothetical protein